MNWLIAIIVGGLAGWIAEKIMKSDTGLLMNIALGIVGALALNAILAALGIVIGTGWLSFLISGVVGACLLIWLYRVIRR